ncbi:MAG TPA: EamA family transporter [Azospirillaceae bacterium]|nr:EamA family transporter [Azospirillaceae bacterium]
MPPSHIALALLVAAIWGMNFIMISTALDVFPPVLLTALRFALAALPVLFLPRPPVSWRNLTMISLPLFAAPYALLFLGMANGMPPGFASVMIQSQAFFTMAFGALWSGERPGPRPLLGAAVAFAGLLLAGSTVGTDVSWIGFGLTIAAAASWGIGNVQMRTHGKGDVFALTIWLSLIPPVPLLAASLVFEGPDAIAQALTHPSWGAVLSLLYIAAISTVAGFGIWGHLMRHHPAGTVAPFSMLVPLFGLSSAALVMGESFGPTRLAGMALVVAGIGLVVLRLPARRRPEPVPAESPPVEGVPRT